MPEGPSRGDEIQGSFRVLLTLEPEERAARIAALDRSDPELAGEVRQLFDHAERAGEAFEGRLRAAAAASFHALVDRPDVHLPSGLRVGAWRLLEPVGTGGMGTVYLAERADGAFEMRAAVKMVRIEGPRLEERLAAERQMLARLDHPGIARLLDGGTSEGGQAYLVMEWVPGVDLEHARPADAGTALDMFLQVADAVAHAHQRLIVHGDIKPSNVRVMDDGRARLVDFGVARLLERDAAGVVYGVTPAFAAPEQLSGGPATTQTDIWALGGLLNWLVTGKRPESAGSIKAGDMKLPRARELLAIIGRAMAADPAARYPTVDALREDVRLLRERRPVKTVRTSVLRYLWLWMQRHRLAATLGFLCLFSAVIGVLAVAWQARVAMAERDAARFEYRRYETMRDHLAGLFAQVAADVDVEQLTARELLDESARRLTSASASVENEAEMRIVLAELYIALQDFASAKPLLESIPLDDEASLSPILRGRAYYGLAGVLHRLGDNGKALAYIDEALHVFESLPGDHRRRRSEARQIRGRILRSLGRWPEAIAELEAGVALARGTDGPSRTLADAENSLAATLLYGGRLQDAKIHFRRALDTFRAVGAGDSSDALTVMGNLAGALHMQGLLGEAETLYEEAIATRRLRFGDSGAMGALHTGYGSLLLLRNRMREARDHLQRGLALQARYAGKSSPAYAMSLMRLGSLELSQGNLSGADEHLSESESTLSKALGADHLLTLRARAERVFVLRHRDPERAVAAFAEIIGAFESKGALADNHLADALCEQATLYLDLGRPRPASTAARRCLAMRAAALPQAAWQRAEAKAIVGACELAAGDPAAASRLEGAAARLSGLLAEEHPRVQWLLARLRPRTVRTSGPNSAY
ncbi:protein kinase domain-containing protein [Luteimonas salinilitoris]|uniref:Tetratricopeptide repeat protein n=1 Tax=Luteimonas salinilitoris TaxID=3237697 RepID=A0ABV4HQU1_9GAMM